MTEQEFQATPVPAKRDKPPMTDEVRAKALDVVSKALHQRKARSFATPGPIPDTQVGLFDFSSDDRAKPPMRWTPNPKAAYEIYHQERPKVGAVKLPNLPTVHQTIDVFSFDAKGHLFQVRTGEEAMKVSIHSGRISYKPEATASPLDLKEIPVERKKDKFPLLDEFLRLASHSKK